MNQPLGLPVVPVGVAASPLLRLIRLTESGLPKESGPLLRTTLSLMVGTAGLEPATSSSRTMRATKLRYVPIGTDVRGPLPAAVRPILGTL